MRKVRTASGFEMEADENRLDDMELLDAIVRLDEGDMLAMPVVIGKICGEGKKRLYDHCREEDGRVPIEKLTTEVTEIFNALNAKKS